MFLSSGFSSSSSMSSTSVSESELSKVCSDTNGLLLSNVCCCDSVKFVKEFLDVMDDCFLLGGDFVGFVGDLDLDFGGEDLDEYLEDGGDSNGVFCCCVEAFNMTVLFGDECGLIFYIKQILIKIYFFKSNSVISWGFIFKIFPYWRQPTFSSTFF